MGAQMVREVASKTNDQAGDGTTTATVLAQEIISVGLKNVTAGANPMDLKRGIDKAVETVVADLKKQTQEVGEDMAKVEQIATTSANNDAFIGKLIAEAMGKVKKEGVVTVEEAPRQDGGRAREPEDPHHRQEDLLYEGPASYPRAHRT